MIITRYDVILDQSELAHLYNHLSNYTKIDYLCFEAVPPHCWCCGPALDQDACDEEIEYRQCDLDTDVCVVVNGLEQPYYVRTCGEYDYGKWLCETGRLGQECEVNMCTGDCIANIGSEGKIIYN